MKTRPYIICAILSIAALNQVPLRAQAELVRESLFPAELEFKELLRVNSQQELKGALPVKEFKDSQLFEEAGLKKYEERTYDVEGGGRLRIEIVDMIDKRAAYSLLTLLHHSKVFQGPPGDFYVSVTGFLSFCQDGYWVRTSSSASDDLVRRVSISVSNRIGRRNGTPPSLITHLPETGLDLSTVRYFIGPKAFQTYGTTVAKRTFTFGPEMELVQASYSRDGETGILSLISFPTGQLAETFFDGGSTPDSREKTAKIKSYAKRAGPLVAILEGDFVPGDAEAILGQIKFAYSIKWIYDKNNRTGQTIWGVPVGILGTVVRSLMLTALLCLASLGAGLAMALFRIALRGYAPNNFLDRPERTELIRLKINED